MSRKRILHICLSEAWGGLEMAVTRWNDILSENGHTNLNVCTPDSPLAQDLKSNDYDVIEWDSAKYFAPDFTYKLRKLIKNNHFNAVVLQNLRDLWIVSPALWGIENVKLIGFTQMLTNVKKKDFLHRKIYNRMDMALTLTDWQQKALAPYLPIPPEKYHTIPNFVDCKSFHPDWRSDDRRYQLGFKKEHFVIGIIGRIDEQKGQWELLRAFAKIIPNFKNARLMIVGEATLGEPKQEAYFKKLKDFVSDLKMQNRVFFKGFQKETNKLTANFDLFVLASHQETFGFVVVEAMASGTPVLGTQAGGVPEILGNGKRGYLCQPKNINDMAEKLEHILTNAEERHAKAQEALSYTRGFYHRQKVYERFIDLL